MNQSMVERCGARPVIRLEEFVEPDGSRRYTALADILCDKCPVEVFGLQSQRWSPYLAVYEVWGKAKGLLAKKCERAAKLLYEQGDPMRLLDPIRRSDVGSSLSRPNLTRSEVIDLARDINEVFGYRTSTGRGCATLGFYVEVDCPDGIMPGPTRLERRIDAEDYLLTESGKLYDLERGRENAAYRKARQQQRAIQRFQRVLNGKNRRYHDLVDFLGL